MCPPSWHQLQRFNGPKCPRHAMSGISVTFIVRIAGTTWSRIFYTSEVEEDKYARKMILCFSERSAVAWRRRVVLFNRSRVNISLLWMTYLGTPPWFEQKCCDNGKKWDGLYTRLYQSSQHQFMISSGKNHPKISMCLRDTNACVSMRLLLLIGPVSPMSLFCFIVNTESRTQSFVLNAISSPHW